MKLHSDTYDSYKNAEGEWSETIPSEWKEVRVKDLFKLVTDAAPADNDYELLSLYAGIGVKPRKDMEARGNKASSTDGYWVVRKNDIVVNKLLAWMGSVGLSEYDGVTSPAYDVLRQVKTDIDPRYFAYLFRTKTAKMIFRKNSRGIMDMRLRLYFDKLGAITVSLPSIKDQISISNYISERAEIIDNKVKIYEKKIKTLLRLKSVLIKTCIRHGIPSNSSSSNTIENSFDTNNESRKTLRIKEAFKEINGYGFPVDAQGDKNGEIPFYKVSDINGQDYYVSTAKNYVTQETIAIKKWKMAPKGTIITGKIGEALKKNHRKITSKNCLFDNNCLGLIPNRRIMNEKFSYYLLKTIDFGDFCNAGAVPAVSMRDLKAHIVSIPPIKQQVAIADYLDKKMKYIDSMVNTHKNLITKNNDLMEAMINDSVTGKIKVPTDRRGASK